MDYVRSVNKTMKKNIAFLIMLILIFSIITVIIINCTNINSKQSEKIEIIATLFPQYDFAKQIGGDKVNVTLLLPPADQFTRPVALALRPTTPVHDHGDGFCSASWAIIKVVRQREKIESIYFFILIYI